MARLPCIQDHLIADWFALALWLGEELLTERAIVPCLPLLHRPSAPGGEGEKSLGTLEDEEILAELVAGSTDAAGMANLARGKLRAKIPALEQALVGRMRPHQQFLIAQQLAHIDALDEAIDRVSEEIAKRTRPFAEPIALLDTIPGIAQRTAEVMVAEIGTDMTRFPTADHLASWAGLAPGNNESGGKRRSGKTRKGSPWLRAALVEAAHGAGRKKDTYLQAQYRQLTRRKGRKRAAVAVAHSIIVIAYHVIKERRPYSDLGPDYLDRRRGDAMERHMVKQLQARGYTISREAA